MLVSALIEIVCKMALAYQVQFLEPLSEPLNLLGVEVGGHADLVARLVAHLDDASSALASLCSNNNLPIGEIPNDKVRSKLWFLKNRFRLWQVRITFAFFCRLSF